MNKAKKMSNGKKVAIVGLSFIGFILLLVIIATLSSPSGEKVYLTEVLLGDIAQTLDTSGTIESANETQYTLPIGTRVNTVNVKVGDRVKKGDLLATFDVSSLYNVLDEKQKNYDAAISNYNSFMSSSGNTESRLSEMNSKIASVEQKIAELNEQLEREESSNHGNQGSQSGSIITNLIPEQYRGIAQRILDMGGTIEQVLSAIGRVTSGGMFDVSSIFGGSSVKSELIQAEMELLQLNAQKGILSTNASGALGSVYKATADSAKKSLDEIKETINNLSNGWVASTDGVVTAVNIKGGDAYEPSNDSNVDWASILGGVTSGNVDVNSILGSITSTNNGVGIAISSYEELAVVFTIDKYDILNVKVGQSAKITTINRDFDGEVAFISPTASTQGGLDLGSIASSLTGGGSSSGASVPAKLSIFNPDESVIVGLDVDVSIKINEAQNTIVLPIEAIQFTGEGQYIYVYDEKKKTVSKREVDLGLSSDTAYQILSGVGLGDKVVKGPSATLEDGAKVAPQKEEATTNK